MRKNIVFTDDEDKSYCNQKYCGGLLIPWKNESMVCSLCEHVYPPDSIKKHKAKLGPANDPYEREGPIVISMDDYAGKPKKKETVLDKEEKHWISQGSGRSIIDIEEWIPGEREDNNR